MASTNAKHKKNLAEALDSLADGAGVREDEMTDEEVEESSRPRLLRKREPRAVTQGDAQAVSRPTVVFDTIGIVSAS